MIVVCVAWEYGGRVPISPAFPTFGETMVALGGLLVDGSLQQAFLITLQPLALGLLISVVVGIGLGVTMGLSRPAEWLGSPLFIIAQSAPLAALIPILTFAYGIGLTSKVLTVCIMAMPVIVLNSLNAVRHTPANLLEMCHAWFASDFTSEATTAKPLPASPARAASMVAFSASRLVCSAIS
ncbi:hypothetical protein BAL199_19061 [alpha proteobacterium BAL199]|nr:hypothetical protein BAL199_19061 [alpha proteobacterium BAL199]